MKVTLYIDGEHNTVEVKDKIKSVLPDARYMIFHPAENMGKVTYFDQIKNMSVDEMADYISANYKCRKCVYYSKNCCNGDCHNGIKEWLESEVETE